MKFADLTLRFDEPNIWKYKAKEDNTRGLRFFDVMEKDIKFNRMKDEIKSKTSLAITDAVDAAGSEQEVGENLDPIFERFNKSFFCDSQINGDLLMKKANKNTLGKKLQPWCKQLNINAPLIRKTPGAHVFYNKLKNVPAIIVCAGPSLKNSIDRIKALKGKCVIIATDTVFRSLMKRGIEPDFMNAHDANENGAKFFQGIKSNCIGLMVNYIHPNTIAAYNGPKAFYYVADDSVGTYTTMALACDGPERKDGSFLQSKITGGSSVAHTAYYFALEFGCNPITFVGLDLSYPDLKNSHFETDNPKDLSKKKLIDVENITGEKCKTDLSFYSYKHVFDKMAGMMAYSKRSRVYTSTEDDKGRLTGIVHEGLEPLPFNEFITKYATSDRPEINNILKEYRKHG